MYTILQRCREEDPTLVTRFKPKKTEKTERREKSDKEDRKHKKIKEKERSLNLEKDASWNPPIPVPKKSSKHCGECSGCLQTENCGNCDSCRYFFFFF